MHHLSWKVQMREQNDPTVSHRPLVVGVTGGAGSGKSTVTRFLGALGAQTADADAIVRWTYLDPDFRRKLVDRFGPDALREDGSVNRDRLASVIFSDQAARRDLEALVHPAVLDCLERMIEEYRAEPERGPMLVLEIPLLFEAGAERLVDRVVVVTAPQQVREERLARRGWSPERIAGVLRSQMPLQEKAARADYVVEAHGPLDGTGERVEALWHRLLNDAGSLP
jgi:dephospho-CoA kinase